MRIRIGTRGSALALAQARTVADLIGADSELVIVRTAGDASAKPLHQLGEGVFVTALEDALRAGEIDVAVHSLKDLPTDDRPGLVIAAVPSREDPRDVVVSRARDGIHGIPNGGRVGTSSPRRAAFMRLLRPDVETVDIRGNVDTRLRKIADGDYDATVLAYAGLRRLDIDVHPRELLEASDMPPAPGQGALALQCRAGDPVVRNIVALDDHSANACTSAERALLRMLGASCTLPFGALATIGGGEIALDAAIVRDGGIARAHVRGTDPRDIAVRAAAALGEPVHA